MATLSPALSFAPNMKAHLFSKTQVIYRTFRHLHLHEEEHKHSVIGKHLMND